MISQVLLGLLALAGLIKFFFFGDVSFGSHRISDADLQLGLSSVDFSLAPSHAFSDYYASSEARSFCAAHGFSVFQPSTRAPDARRKVYDLFMVNTELDFLEIRLRTLYDHVDYFVIVESPLTFQGGDKPMTIRDNWDRFEPYHSKMIYHRLVFPEGFDPQRTWDYEDLQRDAMLDQVFPTLEGRRAPVYGDVLVVADVDEIPRPETLLLLRTCSFPPRLTLASRFYYYSFQFLHTGHEWAHPQATFYRGEAATIRPTKLRGGDGGLPLLREREKATLANAAWHCSSCFATVSEFLNKMSSFSHTWMNNAQYRSPDHIAAAVREGRDVWGRSRDQFVRVEGNRDVPAPLLAERERFRYMLDRDGDTAGFSDYP